jgi:trimethylamine--corrinoid protein Co-methyltransferase
MVNIKWLSDKELNDFHHNSLNIIEKTGFKLDDIDLLKKLKGFDAVVDFETKTIKIPRKISEFFIKKVPEKIKLYGINPEFDIELNSEPLYRPISGTINIYEEFQTIRKPEKKDVEKIAKIVENLDLMHINATAVLPFDVPISAMDVTAAKINFENCAKHTLVDTLNESSFLTILEMAFEISGSEKFFKERPFFQVHFPATSPLIFDRNACANLKLATKYNIPIRIGSSPMSGGNSPIKLAGTILLMNVEILAGIIVAQMLNEGNPVFYGAAPTLFDMKFGTMSWGAPEHAKMAALSSDLAKYYRVYSTSTGFATDSKTPDSQAIMEKTNNALLAALSGVNIIAGAGLLEGELTYSPIQLIVDNEIAQYTNNILRDIDFKLDTSAALIQEIGIGGNYLYSSSTLNLYKTEHEIFSLLDRRTRSTWDKFQNKDIYSKAIKILGDILAKNSRNTIPKRVIDKIEEIYLSYLRKDNKGLK